MGRWIIILVMLVAGCSSSQEQVELSTTLREDVPKLIDALEGQASGQSNRQSIAACDRLREPLSEERVSDAIADYVGVIQVACASIAADEVVRNSGQRSFANPVELADMVSESWYEILAISSPVDRDLSAAAREFVVDLDQEYGQFADGFTADDILVVESFEDGECAGVHVIEPDHEGWSGEMTVYLRRTGGEWEPIDYVTGHGAVEHLDPSNSDCWRD